MLLTFTESSWDSRFKNFKKWFRYRGPTKSLVQIENRHFVVTGTLRRYSRAEIENVISRHGGIFQTSVNHQTDYLVVTDAMMSSGRKTVKMRNAESIGVDIVGETDLYSVIDSL